MRFGCVDTDDSHAAVSKAEGVAVDDAGEAATSAAAGEGAVD